MKNCETCGREHAGECDPADIAGLWLSGYFLAQDDVSGECLSVAYEVEEDEKWNERCRFVAQCMAAGIKPVHYAECLLDHARDYYELYDATTIPPIAVIPYGPPASGKSEWITVTGMNSKCVTWPVTAEGLRELVYKEGWRVFAIDAAAGEHEEAKSIAEAAGFLVAMKECEPDWNRSDSE